MPTVLVGGATANTGSKLVELLSASGSVDIKALVRNPDAEAAIALSKLPNVTLVKVISRRLWRPSNGNLLIVFGFSRSVSPPH